MLDTVPDKVLICSKPSKDRQPTLIYANRQIKQFFGGKIETETEDGKKNHSLGLQIFQELDIDDIDYVDSMTTEKPETFSINDILIRRTTTSFGGVNTSIDGSGSVMRFQVVRPSNQYEADDANAEQKRQVVEIKILDVLYDNQVCKLAYLRDITKLHKHLRETQLNTEEQTQTNDFLKNPERFVANAVEIFKRKHGSNVSETFDETANALIESATKLMKPYEVSTGDERRQSLSSPVKTVKVEKINIRDFFESAVRESSELQREKQLKVNINVDMTMPVEVVTVKEQLFHAVTSSLRQALLSAKHLGRFDLSLNSHVKAKTSLLLIDFDWQTEEWTNELSISSSTLLQKEGKTGKVWGNSLCASFEEQAGLVEALGGDF